MNKFFSLIFNDPILLTATIIFVITIAVLAWALRLRDENAGLEPLEESLSDEEDINTPQAAISTNSENSSIIEAHLKEMSVQISEISQRLANLENSLNNIPKNNNTAQTIDTSSIERLIERLEVKLNLIATNITGNQQSIDLTPLESKLEGIQKLLVFLTDSGNTSNQK